jgi:protein-S-isoprenylcysteine O-methyltransferase Ste14
MEKMSFYGIGPKIGMIALPFLALAIVFSIVFAEEFHFTSFPNTVVMITGIVLLVVGAVLYGFTVRLLLKGLKEIRLVTNGPYYLCKNPLYACFILFWMPGLAFVLNSWLVLLTSFVIYAVFKFQIKKEYDEMEKYFGQEWINYHSTTPEILPFPYKKWF